MPQTTTDLEWSLTDHLLHVLGDALDLRDNETAGHSRRVVRYCLEIATAIGCSGDESRQIAWAAYVHDVGKIAIPDAILCKPNRLTAEEFEVMKTHTWLGYNMLRGVPHLAPIAELVLSHHERWDGGGYPRGLKGEEIALEARVFVIADTLDAMTTDRPYRKALPLSAALDEINRESGRQFDPKIAEVFLCLPKDAVRELVLAQKRSSLRIPLDSQARCRANGEDRVLQVVNVSEGGMLCGNAFGVEINTALDAEFQLPGVERLLGIRGTVVRKELPARIAVAFINISPDALEAIREYVGQRVEV